MLNQIKRAIEPIISLVEVIGQWQNIARQLAEPPRKRKVQLFALSIQAQIS
jgi:hypothetical protein